MTFRRRRSSAMRTISSADCCSMTLVNGAFSWRDFARQVRAEKPTEDRRHTHMPTLGRHRYVRTRYHDCLCAPWTVLTSDVDVVRHYAKQRVVRSVHLTRVVSAVFVLNVYTARTTQIIVLLCFLATNDTLQTHFFQPIQFSLTLSTSCVFILYFCTEPYKLLL